MFFSIADTEKVEEKTPVEPPAEPPTINLDEKGKSATYCTFNPPNKINFLGRG